MNLTGRPVFVKGQKCKRAAKPQPDSTLIAAARLKGTDQQFLNWLKAQPSAIDGAMDYDRDSGKTFCDPCHYRTAKNSGTSTKPEYSAIPMTHAQHLEQHRVGQFAFRPRDWWEEQVERYLHRWIDGLTPPNPGVVEQRS